MDKNWENVKMLANKLEWFDERHPAYESIFVEFGENTDEKKELTEDREADDIPTLLRAIADRTDLKK